jgi:hypothetical protein
MGTSFTRPLIHLSVLSSTHQSVSPSIYPVRLSEDLHTSTLYQVLGEFWSEVSYRRRGN